MEHLKDVEIRFLEFMIMQYFDSRCTYFDSIVSKASLKEIINALIIFYQQEDKKSFTNHRFIIQRIYVEKAEVTDDLLQQLTVSRKTLNRYRIKYMTKFKDLLDHKYDADLITYR